MRFTSIEFEIGAVRPADLPAGGLSEVAFAGRSNVGKSSLINRLVQRKMLARTSSTPGKTQQLNYYLAESQVVDASGSRRDERFYLVDLPGYGYVRGGLNLRSKLGKIVERYIADRDPLRAVLQLVDARHGPTELDLQMIDWLRESGKPFLVVFTKADKLSRNKLSHRLDQLDAQGTLAGISFVPFSAVDGRGKNDILGWVAEALGAEAV